MIGFRHAATSLTLLAGLLLSACSPSLSLGSAPSPAYVVSSSGAVPVR
ncbi:MAG: hypothetical protein JWR10_947 [Rubritepida sp.]|nr:hypothetical protein [Rubritepida sp.]